MNTVIVRSITNYETYLRKQKQLPKPATMKNIVYPPLHKEWLKLHYWDLEIPARQIAHMIGTSAGFVNKELTRLGLCKKENGTALRGKKGYKMPWLERLKHHHQPHARRVSKIDPHTMHRVEIYPSIAAAGRDGFREERIRHAIKTNGMHRGYKWENV